MGNFGGFSVVKDNDRYAAGDGGLIGVLIQKNFEAIADGRAAQLFRPESDDKGRT